MRTDPELAAFQAALLGALCECEDPEQILQRLREHPACAPFLDDVAGFEPRMVALAAELVKKWGAVLAPAPGSMPEGGRGR